MATEGSSTRVVDVVEKLVDRLPYADGSGRRRLVAGGIILIGGLFYYQRTVAGFLGDLSLRDVLASPILLAASFLIVYAVGTLVDLLGEILLVRVAGGVLWATRRESLPPALHARVPTAVSIPARVLLMPVLAAWFALRGLFGIASYRLALARDLSAPGRRYFDGLPGSVKEGLEQPFGHYGESALRFLISRLPEPSDKRWAHRLVARGRDVLTVTTAIVILATVGLTELISRPSHVHEVRAAKSALPEHYISVNSTDIDTLRWTLQRELSAGLDAVGDAHRPSARARVAVAHLEKLIAVIRQAPSGVGDIDQVCQLMDQGLDALEAVRIYTSSGTGLSAKLEPIRANITTMLSVCPSRTEPWAPRRRYGNLLAAALDVTRQVGVVVIVGTLPLMILYSVFFKAHRQAVATILEANALEQGAG